MPLSQWDENIALSDGQRAHAGQRVPLRVHRLVGATCGRCGEENPGRARFCLACGTPLAGAAVQDEARKTVTILRCDVTDFTGLGDQLDPELLRQVMSRFFEEMRKVVERHGGTVEKFIGDAVMAVFGVPQLHEDDALRAVRAAIGMREALAALNEKLRARWGFAIEMRIGINTGEVVAGNARDGGEHVLVTGDAVNVAARLEEGARPGEILLGRETLRLVRDAVRVIPVQSLRMKGKTKPVPAFRLVEVLADIPAPARTSGSPFVGREDELELLRQAFHRTVRDRTTHLFTVLGPAGVGKSRLASEFVAAVEGEAQVLVGRCLAYGDGITFWPVYEAVRQAARLADADSADEARAKIARLLEGEENAAMIGERVAQMIGLLDVGRGAEEMFWALRKLLEALARRRPLVVVFDDVHAAEPTFLDLVEYVAEWAREAPILLVCLARTELYEQRPGWAGGKVNAASITLEPLSEGECALLIDNLIGFAEASPGVRRRIAEATEGNPLFVEELISMLVDEGALQHEGDRWGAGDDLSELAIPATIYALLAARLDRLGPDERHVIERASVEGKVFRRRALAALSSAPVRERLDSVIARLVRRDLIRPDHCSFGDEESYRFRHILIRDAAYQAMPKAVRADLHERFAGWLEQAAGERAREWEELLGYHLEQAHRYRSELGRPDGRRTRDLGARAATRLASAGRRAFVREDMPAAASLLGRATSLSAHDDPERLERLPDLGAALMDLGRLSDARLVLEEAAELALAAGNERVERRAVLERAQMSIDPNRVAAEEIRAEAERAISVFERLGDAQGLSKAWRLVGETHLLSCRGAAAQEAMLQAAGYAVEAGDLREKAESLRWLARAVMLGPTPVEEAIERCRASLADAGEYPVAVASTSLVLGALVSMQGRMDEGRKLIAKGRDVLEDMGLRFRLAQSAFLGRVEMLAGAPDAAERDLRRGYQILQRMGEKSYYFPLVTALLAHAVEAQDRARAALALTEESERWATAGDLLAQILWRGARGKALAALGDVVQGEALTREAVRLAEGTDFLWDRGDALLDLAAVLRRKGDEKAAAAATRRAFRRYERKGITIVADRLGGETAVPV